MKQALIDILRIEHQDLLERIAREQDTVNPDMARIADLRNEADSIARQLARMDAR